MIKRVKLTKYDFDGCGTYYDDFFSCVICAGAVYEFYGVIPQHIILVISSRARKDYYKVYHNGTSALKIEGENKTRHIWPSLGKLLNDFPRPCYIGVEY